MILRRAMALALLAVATFFGGAPSFAEGLRFPVSAGGPNGAVVDEAPYHQGEVKYCMAADVRTPVRAAPSAQSPQIWILPRQRYAVCLVGLDGGWGVFATLRSPHIGSINDFVRTYRGHYVWVELAALGYKPHADCTDYRIRKDDVGYEYPSEAEAQRRQIDDRLFCFENLGNVRGSDVVVVFYEKAARGQTYQRKRPTSLRGCNTACLADARCKGHVYRMADGACELLDRVTIPSSVDTPAELVDDKGSISGVRLVVRQDR